MQEICASRNTDKVSYPNISQETARRARLWAKRIFYLLPKLLAYRTDRVRGLRNYYLPTQQIFYTKEVELAIEFCKALQALL